MSGEADGPEENLSPQPPAPPRPPGSRFRRADPAPEVSALAHVDHLLFEIDGSAAE